MLYMLYIHGYNTFSELHPERFYCDHSPFPDRGMKFYGVEISEEGVRTLEITFVTEGGVCSSGYTTASWGRTYTQEIDVIPPLEYQGLVHFESMEEFMANFEVSYDGGDRYYPCGFVNVNHKLLENFKEARVKRDRLYVFQGASALGKSTFALKLASCQAEIYETDKGEPLPSDSSQIKYIVLGNKNPELNKKVMKAIGSLNRTVIKVTFEEESTAQS